MPTSLAIIEPEYLEVDVFSEPDVTDEIETLLDSIANHELRLGASYVRLGLLLLKAQKSRKWKGHTSFARYLGYIEERIGRARAQLYAYVGVAERLLPYVSETDLEEMGISRAQELVRYVKQSGLAVPEHLRLAALDSKVKLGKLHVQVSEELHIKSEVTGQWYEFGGFYVTPEEKQEIQQAIERARGMAAFGSDAPDHHVRKEVMLAFAREFVSSNPEE